jgi:pyridoxal phosphate enzyme (YggS family)
MDGAEAEAIRQRLADVQRRIARAAERAGRDPNEVSLVVITKGHPLRVVQWLLDCGPSLLGENRVEEALPKIDAIGERPGVAWHLVGTLQSRKVRLVGGRFELIHSVDRLKVARLLDRNAAQLNRIQAVLLEWNVGGEASKSGWRQDETRPWEPILAEHRAILALPNLSVRGLMTVGPLTDDVELQRQAFRRLSDLRRRLRNDLGHDLPELSMGMTDDFEAAIQEGATLVRIGRAILGERM